MIGLSELRAGFWKYGAILAAALGVVALFLALFLWGRLGHASARADAAEQRAQALAGEVAALKEAGKRDDASADATKGARNAAAARQPIQEARAAKVKGYADSAGSACVSDPRIVRELADGEGRFRAASDRLRGHGRPEGAATKPADR